ncbi:Centrosomal protein poc5 [Dinochytrium kinnereticum]|nr:Centrosomal protein poc5 [Dinochytrium kinnereticum]
MMFSHRDNDIFTTSSSISTTTTHHHQNVSPTPLSEPTYLPPPKQPPHTLDPIDEGPLADLIDWSSSAVEGPAVITTAGVTNAYGDRAGGLTDGTGTEGEVGGGKREPVPPLVREDAAIPDPDASRFEASLDKWTVLMRKAIMTEFNDSQASLARRQDKAIEAVGRRYVETVASLNSQLRDAQDLAALYRMKFEARNGALENAATVIGTKHSQTLSAVFFSRWRTRLIDHQRFQLAKRFADQRAKSNLLRHIVLGWQRAAGATWRRTVEKRVRIEAEKAISQLSAEYESRIAELSKTLAQTQTLLHESETHRSRSQEEMKRALMRGVCALNMEAMSVFRPLPSNTPVVSFLESLDDKGDGRWEGGKRSFRTAGKVDGGFDGRGRGGEEEEGLRRLVTRGGGRKVKGGPIPLDSVKR